jgi:hypothetical protein
MPFGLAGAGSSFSRLMKQVLSPLGTSFVSHYFDEIVVFSNSYNDHIRHLKSVFNILQRNKLFLNPDKIKLGTLSIAFLGHLISQN